MFVGLRFAMVKICSEQGVRTPSNIEVEMLKSRFCSAVASLPLALTR